MLTLVFPWMVTHFAPGYVFGFFCFMMVLELIWVIFMVPETKGKTLEEMEALWDDSITVYEAFGEADPGKHYPDDLPI